MKGLLAMGMVTLVLGASAVCGVANTHGRERDRFAGAWRLARLERQGADGKIHRIDCCGMFVFTRDGHASVQVMEGGVMEREVQEPTATGAEQYAQGGYEASYGRYDIDEGSHTFVFHVDGALVRNLIGKDLQRAYEFSGKQLIVRPTRADEHWRVVWERY